MKFLSKLFFIWWIVMILVFMYSMFTDKRYRVWMWVWVALCIFFWFYGKSIRDL